MTDTGLGVLREWASSPEYKAPVPFLEMQRRGREMERGTVIVGSFFRFPPSFPKF